MRHCNLCNEITNFDRQNLIFLLSEHKSVHLINERADRQLSFFMCPRSSAVVQIYIQGQLKIERSAHERVKKIDFLKIHAAYIDYTDITDKLRKFMTISVSFRQKRKCWSKSRTTTNFNFQFLFTKCLI